MYTKPVATVIPFPSRLTPLAARVRGLTDTALADAARAMGPGPLGDVETTVRVALLDEYERRHGGDAVDDFMAQIGL